MNERLAAWRKRAQPPALHWAIIELILAAAVISAGLVGYTPFSSTPWLLALAAVFFWWRGPGWRHIGLRRPTRAARTLLIGVIVGIAYQFFGLYVLEPLIARATTGELPDVSMFQSVVGNETRLAFWLAISWTLAAFMEEMVFRGWLTVRLAELGRFSNAAWIVAALAASTLFGAVHLYQGASGMMATGLTGLAFAGVYFAAGRNLWAPILAHGFMDTTGFVMIYLGIYPGIRP